MIGWRALDRRTDSLQLTGALAPVNAVHIRDMYHYYYKHGSKTLATGCAEIKNFTQHRCVLLQKWTDDKLDHFWCNFKKSLHSFGQLNKKKFKES